MKKVMLLHGVNHNMFGKRDPKQYGTITLDGINKKVDDLAKELDIEVTNFQTNNEGEFVDKIHEAYLEGYDGVMLNAGAWTHYSHAIGDALRMLECPVIELHMSNVHARRIQTSLSYITNSFRNNSWSWFISLYFRTKSF